MLERLQQWSRINYQPGQKKNKFMNWNDKFVIFYNSGKEMCARQDH